MAHLPNLACLAVNQSGKPGEAYPGNWELDMLAVANFNWSNAPEQLAIYVAEATLHATPPHKVSEEEARKAIYMDYKRDECRYNSFEHDDREEMVNLIMAGVDLEDAYLMVIDAIRELSAIG